MDPTVFSDVRRILSKEREDLIPPPPPPPPPPHRSEYDETKDMRFEWKLTDEIPSREGGEDFSRNGCIRHFDGWIYFSLGFLIFRISVGNINFGRFEEISSRFKLDEKIIVTNPIVFSKPKGNVLYGCFLDLKPSLHSVGYFSLFLCIVRIGHQPKDSILCSSLLVEENISSSLVNNFSLCVEEGSKRLHVFIAEKGKGYLRECIFNQDSWVSWKLDLRGHTISSLKSSHSDQFGNISFVFTQKNKGCMEVWNAAWSKKTGWEFHNLIDDLPLFDLESQMQVVETGSIFFLLILRCDEVLVIFDINARGFTEFSVPKVKQFSCSDSHEQFLLSFLDSEGKLGISTLQGQPSKLFKRQKHHFTSDFFERPLTDRLPPANCCSGLMCLTGMSTKPIDQMIPPFSCAWWCQGNFESSSAWVAFRTEVHSCQIKQDMAHTRLMLVGTFLPSGKQIEMTRPFHQFRRKYRDTAFSRVSKDIMTNIIQYLSPIDILMLSYVSTYFNSLLNREIMLIDRQIQWAPNFNYDGTTCILLQEKMDGDTLSTVLPEPSGISAWARALRRKFHSLSSEMKILIFPSDSACECKLLDPKIEAVFRGLSVVIVTSCEHTIGTELTHSLPHTFRGTDTYHRGSGEYVPYHRGSGEYPPMYIEERSIKYDLILIPWCEHSTMKAFHLCLRTVLEEIGEIGLPVPLVVSPVAPNFHRFDDNFEPGPWDQSGHCPPLFPEEDQFHSPSQFAMPSSEQFPIPKPSFQNERELPLILVWETVLPDPTDHLSLVDCCNQLNIEVLQKPTLGVLLKTCVKKWLLEDKRTHYSAAITLLEQKKNRQCQIQ